METTAEAAPSSFELRTHWDARYKNTATDKLTWHQPEPVISLRLFEKYGSGKDSVLDVGAGSSLLTKRLREAGYADLTVLDISEQALAGADELGSAPSERIVGDITEWQPHRQFDVWHDRAVFHFMTTSEQRAAYGRALREAVCPGGIVILATFGIDGPAKCSGLPIVQYDEKTMHAELGLAFELLESFQEEHPTPVGKTQLFQWAVFRRS